MSVQLIVYPQSYEGGFNEISSSPTEFIVNGINFNGLDTTGTYTSSVSIPYVDTLTNAPPSIYNTWYRFRNNAAGTPDYPSVVVGDLVLNSVAGSGSISGIYQKLSNLTIGTQYTITVNFAASSTGNIITQYANGSNIYGGGIAIGIATSFSDTFTAQSTSDTVMFAYYNTVDNDITITDVSIQPVIGAIPSGATNFLENGQVLCDLYEDEDIPLSLSVDDFKNVAEKVQSYSKAFNLPATKRNNRIFDNIFEITRSDDGVIFNPYKKTKCVLKQDGFILFEGYLRMLDITDKEGETSYNVNLYSEVVALADFLGDRAFRDLDFTELEHEYNKTQIRYSSRDAGGGTSMTNTNPNTSGFRDDYTTLRYPFVDWTHQIAVGGSNNNSATVGNPELLTLEAAFRPFINIKYLIDRIFEATPFTYESEFFDSDDFKKLFMDFNWGSNQSSENVTQGSYDNELTPILSTTVYKNYVLDNFLSFEPNLNWVSVDNQFVALNNNTQYNLNLIVWFDDIDIPTGLMDARVAHRDGAGLLINIYGSLFGTSSTTYNLQCYDNIVLQAGDTLAVEWKSDVAGEYRQRTTALGGVNPSTIKAVIGQGLTTTNSLLQNLRGELGQWDFIKGFLTMFNLVTLPDEDNPNNIKFEPYSDVFIPTATGGTTLANRGIEHDWTNKIDVSEMKLTPLTDLNKKTVFKFVEDDDDYSFNQYKFDVGGHLYGSKKYDAWNEFNILVGEDEIVAEPFAATLVKPLMSQFPDFITPAIYSKGGDGVWEGFDNSPRIMYNNGIKDTGTTYYIPAQNDLSSENQANFLQFSHLSDVPTILATPSVTGSRDFHFGICQVMPGVGAPVPDNLFNLYWLPYYAELYNANTRIMTIKVNLSPADINTFKFNDTVYIKNRVFRVNKIDYKPNDLATVEFILIP